MWKLLRRFNSTISFERQHMHMQGWNSQKKPNKLVMTQQFFSIATSIENMIPCLLMQFCFDWVFFLLFEAILNAVLALLAFQGAFAVKAICFSYLIQLLEVGTFRKIVVIVMCVERVEWAVLISSLCWCAESWVLL